MQAVTVTGPIEATELGVTLAHEHLVLDSIRLGDEYEGLFDDVNLMIDEVKAFRDAGGNTIVEQTPIGLGRDPVGLRLIAKATGVNVIMGVGYYKEIAHPSYIVTKTVNELADIMVRDLLSGVGDTGVRAGIIGEIGTGRDFISPAEERVLRAAARAQLQTGAPLATHAIHGTVGLLQLEVLTEEGVDLQRVVLGHLDSKPLIEYQEAVAKRGVFLSYDCIGKNHLQPDARRVALIVEMIKRGCTAQILLSSDVCFRRYLHAFGGFGYDYVLTHFVPMLKDAGVTDHDIHMMLVENPSRAFAFGHW